VHPPAASRNHIGRCCRKRSPLPSQLGVEIFEILLPELCLPCEHQLLGFSKHAIEASKHCEQQDRILILTTFEGVEDLIGDSPKEAVDLVVVLRGRLPLEGITAQASSRMISSH
jgi:hypothetical protein